MRSRIPIEQPDDTSVEPLGCLVNLSIRTVSHIKHFLSGILRYASRTGFLNGANPVRDAVLPKAKAPLEPHAYSLEEVLKRIELLPDPVRTIVAVAGLPTSRSRQS